MTESKFLMPPEDEANQTLVNNVHPPKWINPMPADRYNLVVIGAGTAGLIAAAGAAGLGAKVALIEKHLMGGDCLNVGCVPSKAMIRSARVVAEARRASKFGVKVSGAEADFGEVMKRMRSIRARISKNDSAKRFSELGVDVFIGEGKFAGADAVEVAGKVLRFKKAVLATGARAAAPPVEGLAQAGYLTNETLFSLTELPKRLAVIGAGPIGCEMAQTFRRLGSEVSLFDMAPQILIREDRDAAKIVQDQFIEEGVNLILNSKLLKVERVSAGKVVHYEAEGKASKIEVDEILVGAGRTPNVEGLNLEAVGVEYDKRAGVKVHDHLQTTNANIYACGDICLQTKFTHTAEASAKIVIQNSLFGGKARLSGLVIPWCTYTDPEIAHVGLYAKDAKEKGLEIDSFTQPLEEVDRAITDGQEEGFVKVHVKKGTDQIVGATIVAAHAGEMISELTLAMVGKVGLKTIANVIHPYPTQADAVKRTAYAYNRTRLTPVVKALFNQWLSWTR